MRHLTLQQLSASVDDALTGVSLELVRRHFIECEECRARRIRLARIDDVVAQLISHDPGEAWFAAERVEIEELIRGEIGGSFGPAAHPAGPPPLEAGSAAPPVPAAELEAIWEEGITTPPAGHVEKHVPPPEPVPAARVEPQVAPAESPAPMTPAPAAPIAKAPPPPPVPVATVAKVSPPAPVPIRPVAKVSPPAPVPIRPVAKVSPPAPVPIRPLAKASPPRPATIEPAVAAPPAARGASPTSRWGADAERVAGAPRMPSNAPRETLFPLGAGLVGGAIAGALMVTLLFSQRAGSNHPSPVQPASAPRAAALEPAAGPAIEPAPASEPVRSEPAAPAGNSPTPSNASSSASAPGEFAPTEPAVVPPAVTRPAAASAPPRVAAVPERRPARVAPARPAVDEDSWPLLCGAVTDEIGAPIMGARILLADLDIWARTDRRGRFCISAPPGERTLSVVALGFVPQHQVVSVVAGGPEIRLSMVTAP